MPHVLEAIGLTRTFGQGDARVVAVNEVNLTLEPRELVMLTGDSGCGKTTLISMLGCLLTPSAGSVILDGEPVDFAQPTRLPELRRQKIGFVFQMFNLIPYLTAMENVLIALDIGGIRGPQAAARATDLLNQVGLGHRLEHRPAQLSGGEKQRVSFARALANRPAVLFADEPTANLDSRQSQNLLDLIAELRSHHDTTICLVTHQAHIQEHADRLLRMRDGQIVGVE